MLKGRSGIEDIEVSNLLDIVIRMGVCWLILFGSRTSRRPTATPSLTLFNLRRHTSFSDVNSHGFAGTASHVLCWLNNEHRLVLSLHVLASVKTASKGKWWQKSLRELELEVRSYKSFSLFVNEEPERVVFLSVIEVRTW